MEYSNKINLDELMISVSDQAYCIIKLCDEFPNYRSGSDIDIFCYNLPEFSRKILEIGQSYVEKGYEIKVNADAHYDHCAIDFYQKDILEFRFDLHNILPIYKKLKIKPGLFSSLIENAIPIERNYDTKKYNIYVPNKIDDMLIRYIEYIEWYYIRPDKIKHLDYIINNLEDESERKKLLDKLHYYTEIPKINYKIECRRRRQHLGYREAAVLACKQLRSTPIKEMPSTAIRMLKKINKL